MTTFKLKTFLSGDDYYHIHRYIQYAKDNPVFHRHSYCEIFWIERGAGIHLLNNQRLNIKENHLYIIRSFDSHAFFTKSELQQVNIAFPTESLKNLCQRYNYRLMDTDITPLQWTLHEKHFGMINNLLHTLLSKRNTQFNLELFLMNVVAVLEKTNSKILFSEDKAAHKIPPWMQDFFDLLTDEKNLCLSLDTLSDMVGRTREHISRQIKKYYDKTPSQIMSDARINFAKKQLTMTRKPILDIAFSCGFSSLSQFYKIFKESTGFTPSTFRKNKP